MNLRTKLERLRALSHKALSHEALPHERAPELQSPPAAAQVALDHAAHAPDTRPSPEADPLGRIAELRALIGGVIARDRHKRERVHAPSDEARGPLPWPVVDTEHGPLHVLERWLDPQHQHGRVSVNRALTCLPSTLSALALEPALVEVDLSRMLLLDLETTGLSGGTGTVAFLVGLARFVDGALCVEQLIVPNLGAEAPVLARVSERVRDASCIVTYNGKTFDWPLLRTRFVLNRMVLPAMPPHVDLLHATRRVWKPRLGSVRLTEIEREILRFEREGDIDGAEIPSRYFAFLRDGQADRLMPVLEHNQNDLIALAAMLGRLAQHFECADTQRDSPGSQGSHGSHGSHGAHASHDPHDPIDPMDALAFARLSVRAADPARALSFARVAQDGAHAAGTHTTDTVACSALSLSADVHRRLGNLGQAAADLEQALLAARSELQAYTLHFALAKLYEHEVGDLLRAHRHARFTEAIEGPAAQGKRLGRLRRRMERAWRHDAPSTPSTPSMLTTLTTLTTATTPSTPSPQSDAALDPHPSKSELLS